MTNQRGALIGLGGKKRSGKDTVGTYLVEHYGFKRYAFADKLKVAALTLDPFVEVDGDFGSFRLSDVVAEYGWDCAKDEIPEVRRILQYLGADVARMLDPEIWVNAVRDDIINDLTAGINVVVTDVRFPNEVDFIHQLRGASTYVMRDLGDAADELSGHVSENLDMRTFNHWLDNFSTIENLHEAVDALVQGVLRMKKLEVAA